VDDGIFWVSYEEKPDAAAAARLQHAVAVVAARVAEARARVTVPSSKGWPRASRASRRNSGSSSRNRMP
jgi:hypothetical protein